MLRFGCVLGVLGVVLSAARAEKPVVARTESGRVIGTTALEGKVHAYLGIPYAAPPLDQLRWKGPQPVERWKGLYAAQEFGYRCPQFASYGDMKFRDPGESEDCLTLNVWAPAGAKPGSLPVMVWIYGGGFQSGGTSEARQDGSLLAARGVVVVSMNYRLGIFGFMAHPELAEEGGRGATGNYGLMDQAWALRWVQRNIGAFGGNAANVTVFGESAGSFSVSALMASAQAQGLFAKAIGESGAAFYSKGLPFGPREPAEEATMRFTQAAFGTNKLSYLRTLTTKDVMEAFSAKAAVRAPEFEPVVDGFFLTQPVPDAYAGGESRIPLLAGWNADEGKAFVLAAKEKVTAESFKGLAEREFGAKAGEFLAVYPAGNDAEALRAAEDFSGDGFIAYSTWRWLEEHAKSANAPTYRYRFDLGSPGDRNHPMEQGAFHSDEIEYVFGTLDSRVGAHWRPEDRRLSEQMQGYWVNFARTGDPNGAGLPVWPRYTPGWQVLHLDAVTAARADELRGRYLFLDGVWGKGE